MGVIDQVTQMRQRNMPDSDIISELRKQNISPREINEALNHAQIKNAVSDIRGDENLEAPMPGGGYPPNEGYGQDAGYDQQQMQQQGYDQSQQQTYSPQPQSYQQGGYGDYYQQQPAVNTDTIVEVSEQVFNEKISEFSKKVDSIDEFKSLTQAKLENMNERIKRIEAIMDKMQSAILEKVGSYGSNLESVKKEMSMMQESFAKIAGSRKGRSEDSPEAEESEKSPRKKK